MPALANDAHAASAAAPKPEHERAATQVAERLSQDQSLRATAQRRWLLAGAAIGLGIFVSLGVAGSVSWHRVVVAGARDRIDAALRAGDICAGETVSEHDLAQAREDQLQALAEARQRCDAKRAKQAHVTRCEQLAEHVVRGRLDAADQEAAEDAWPLLQRLAKGALQPEDLQIGHDAMPCADLPSGGILWSAYARAVGTAEAAWGQVETVSPPVRRLFEGRTIELSEGARRSLLSRTENVTKHAIKSGVEEELEQARRLCTLVAVVQPEPEPWCKALARIDRKRE